jgi:hypothetical protein
VVAAPYQNMVEPARRIWPEGSIAPPVGRRVRVLTKGYAATREVFLPHPAPGMEGEVGSPFLYDDVRRPARVVEPFEGLEGEAVDVGWGMVVGRVVQRDGARSA